MNLTLTREQIASAWYGIPEAYWPSPEKPWRVSWGFDAFEDFRSKEQAEERHTELVSSGAVGITVTNVHGRTRELLAKAAG